MAKEFREWRARLDDVHDGDTVRLIMDTGFDTTTRKWLRLRDVPAPELVQNGGLLSETFVCNWLGDHFHYVRNTWPWVVRTYRTKGDNDVVTLGRYVADVECAHCGDSLNVAVTAFLKAHPDWPGGIGSETHG